MSVNYANISRQLSKNVHNLHIPAGHQAVFMYCTTLRGIFDNYDFNLSIFLNSYEFSHGTHTWSQEILFYFGWRFQLIAWRVYRSDEISFCGDNDIVTFFKNFYLSHTITRKNHSTGKPFSLFPFFKYTMSQWIIVIF